MPRNNESQRIEKGAGNTEICQKELGFSVVTIAFFFCLDLLICLKSSIQPKIFWIDCSQPSIFSYFYSIVERANRIASWTQNGRLDTVGGGDRFFVWLASLASPSPSPCASRSLCSLFFSVRWKIGRL